MRLPSTLLLFATAAIAACSSNNPETSPSRSRGRTSRAPSEAAAVREPELERRLARLELRVLEKETQVAELESRLEDARNEVVSTMAKLRTIASRAEAASAMAEADVAIQTLRSAEGSRNLPELAQGTQLMQQSTSEFNKENYGGALYLANQAKSSAVAGRTRISANRGATRPGETMFAVPLRLKVASRGNVREGPGTNFTVAFEVQSGATLTGLAYADEWIRIADDGGRSGWIYRTLIARP